MIMAHITMVWITFAELMLLVLLVGVATGTVTWFVMARRTRRRLQELGNQLEQAASCGESKAATVLEGPDGVGQLSVRVRALIDTLTDSRLRLRTLWAAVEQSPVTVMITDAKGRIEYVNPKFKELTGYDGAEVLGRNPRFLKSGQTPGEQYTELWQTITQGREWRGEILNKARDGRLFWEMASISPLRDTDGCITHFVAVKEDITRQKYIQQEHAELTADMILARDHLERQADQLEAQSEQLAHARKQADAANEAKSAFLAAVSHEIRTPMTSVLGFAELLNDPSYSKAEQRRFVQAILRNGRHLLALITDILDFSKIEAGKMTLEPVAMDVREVVREVLEITGMAASHKGLKLAAEFSGPIPKMIESDPLRLRQILTNLVSNAIKFTSQGGVRLVVQCLPPMTSDSAQKHRMTFEVIDTGVGLDQEQLARLFQPFSQVSHDARQNQGGTGLGLAISRRLANLMQGEVSVSSVPGAGSVFTLTLPLQLDEATQWVTPAGDGTQVMDEALPDSLSTSSTTPVHKQTMMPQGRVLVADDSADNRLLMSMMLRTWGIGCTAVEDGRLAVDEALQKKRDGKPYQLILMDMQMPRVDGIEATKELRAKGYRLPIVMLTAHALPEIARQCEQAGCDQVVTKPVNEKKLHETVLRFLQEKRDAA